MRICYIKGIKPSLASAHTSVNRKPVASGTHTLRLNLQYAVS